MTAQRWPHKQEVSQSFSTGRCLSFHALSAAGCNLSFPFPSFRVPVHLPSTVSVQFLTIFLLDLSSPFPPEPLALALPAAICPTHPLSGNSAAAPPPQLSLGQSHQPRCQVRPSPSLERQPPLRNQKPGLEIRRLLLHLRLTPAMSPWTKCLTLLNSVSSTLRWKRVSLPNPTTLVFFNPMR